MTGEDSFRRRVHSVVAGIALVAVLLATRLVQLQAFESNSYRARARNQHEATVKLDGQRGSITDRNGHELAVSIEVDSAYVHPWQLSNPEAAAADLARILHLDAHQLASKFTAKNASGDRTPFVWVKRKISPTERKALDASPIAPNVHYTRESKRFYPKGGLAAQVLGFVGTDGAGLEGLERDFESTIAGQGASFVVLRDAKGGAILQQVRQAGRPGASLQLTLDETIQYAAETELEAAMQRTQSLKGTIIVMDPLTGEILALANRPTYDPNLYSTSSAASRKNVGIGDRYEPGSTFKIITAAAGLEEGTVRPDEIIDCGNGSILINSIRIHDHHSYSSLPFYDVIAKSSNIGIIHLGLRLGAPKLHSYVEKFGFGRSTGIGLSWP